MAWWYGGTAALIDVFCKLGFQIGLVMTVCLTFDSMLHDHLEHSALVQELLYIHECDGPYDHGLQTAVIMSLPGIVALDESS